MRFRSISRLIVLAWLSLPVMVVGFLVTRYAVNAPWGVAVAQVFYLTSLALAVPAVATAGRRYMSGSRPRLAWSMFSAALAWVLVGEVVTSLEVIGLMEHAAVTAVFDVANAAAMVIAGAALATAAAVDRVEMLRTIRFGLDLTALCAAAFCLLYRAWTVDSLLGIQSAGDAMRLSAYGIAALALFAGNAVALLARPTLRTTWNLLIGSALALIMVGVGIWTVGSFTGWDPVHDAFIAAVSSTVYLSAYHLALMAGLYRIRGQKTVGLTPGPIRPPSAVLGVVISTLVFLSVAVLAWVTLDAARYGPIPIVYAVGLAVATVCTVLRTAIASAETHVLSTRTVTDPVTGGLSAVALARCFSGADERARRTGQPYAVYSLGLDDFSRVNAAVGYRGGDRVLAVIGGALEDAAGEGAWVVRLSGDEFVVLAPVDDVQAAHRLGRRLLAAVAAAGSEHVITASIGLVIAAPGRPDHDQLLWDAQAAQLWAKRHGKNRVALFGARIERALRSEDRLDQAGAEPSVGMARALLAAADARDPANQYHARNVAALARLVAEDLGLSQEHIGRIEMAAVLHDVGKIALPSAMLGGKTLSVRERSTEREHSELGERLLESLSAEGVAAWVRAHHERWDGNGYPDGLAGEAIPLEARLIALADAYDGMTAGKRYGAPMSKAAALQEIDLSIGARFDPELAERFIRVIGETEALGWSDEWPRT